jgi:hypothetical protein
MRVKIVICSLILFIFGVCFGLQMKHLQTYADSGDKYYTAGGPITYPLSFPITYTSVQLPSIFTDDAFTVPTGSSLAVTNSVTAATEVIINILTGGGTSSILLPAETVITRDDAAAFSSTDLTTAPTDTGSLSGLGDGVVVDGALQWGIPNVGVDFSQPISLGIYVGDSYDGQTLNVFRSTDTSSGWTNDGIIDPTCTVESGICNFQTTKASYFAVAETNSSSGQSNSSSSSSGGGSSSCGDTPPTGAPNLFQINTTSTKATLYFAPAAGSVSDYFISYGYTPGDQRFAVLLNQGYSSGVLNFTINYLQPGTTYYFMIRSDNGCATGSWGNEMKITTGRGNSTIKYYKSFATRFATLLPIKTTTVPQTQAVSQNNAPVPTSAPEQPQNVQPVVQPVVTEAPIPTYSSATEATPKPKTCFLFWCW